MLNTALLWLKFGSSQIQDLAIRCIQKNIKKNRGVKDWPWWKLFTTVRPLIQVQLTEEQIRGKDVSTPTGRKRKRPHEFSPRLRICRLFSLQEEIQQLKQKLEKVEKERNELRLNSDRLESRVNTHTHTHTL